MEQKDLEKEVLEEIEAEVKPEDDNKAISEEEAVEAEQVEEVLEGEHRKVVVGLDVDYRTLKYYNVYILKYVRKFYIIYAVFLALLIGGGVYEAIMQQWIITALMGAFALYLGYQMFTIDKTVDKQLTSHFMRRRPQHQTYTFTDEGITVTPQDGGDPIDYEWVFVSNIHEIPQFYYLYLGKQPIIVDRREEMIIEGTKADLDAIIAEQASKKPFKKLEKDILKEPVTFNYPDYDAFEAAQKEEEASEELAAPEEQPEEVIEAKLVEEVKEEQVEEVEKTTEE